MDIIEVMELMLIHITNHLPIVLAGITIPQKEITIHIQVVKVTQAHINHTHRHTSHITRHHTNHTAHHLINHIDIRNNKK